MTTEIDVIADVLHDHRDSGTTSIVNEAEERIEGYHAWCYCGGTSGPNWMKEGPKWRGSFCVPAADAERELDLHIAEQIAAALRLSPGVATDGGPS